MTVQVRLRSESKGIPEKKRVLSKAGQFAKLLSPADHAHSSDSEWHAYFDFLIKLRAKDYASVPCSPGAPTFQGTMTTFPVATGSTSHDLPAYNMMMETVRTGTAKARALSCTRGGALDVRLHHQGHSDTVLACGFESWCDQLVHCSILMFQWNTHSVMWLEMAEPSLDFVLHSMEVVTTYIETASKRTYGDTRKPRSLLRTMTPRLLRPPGGYVN